MKHIFTDSEFLYVLIYTAIVVLGKFNEIFIALLLIDLYYRFPHMKHIFDTVYITRWYSFYLIVLFVIFEYFYGLVAFFALKSDYEPACDTLIGCFSVAAS